MSDTAINTELATLARKADPDEARNKRIAEAFLDLARGFEIKTQEDYNLATEELRKIIDRHGTLDAERKTFTDPLRGVLDRLNAKYMPWLKLLRGGYNPLPALATLLEVGLVGITRLILLDSMLIFFGLAAVTFYTAFRRFDARPFSPRWHWNLLLTGAALGCVASVKWVGFFTVALVGLLTVEELWRLYGDWSVPSRTIARHFAWRTMYLILVPVGIYVLCFAIHFRLLFRSGPGNANMNSLFQASLQGVDFGKSPLEVAYGSRITLRNAQYSAGLLHSHAHMYPKGSKQQQVTTYLHADENNHWLVHRSYADPVPVPGQSQTPSFEDDGYTPQLLKDGDVVRLLHESTRTYLHSHLVTAPLSTGEYEVSGYGGPSHHDPNDLWVVEVARDSYAHRGSQGTGAVRSLYTSIRFRHKATGCYLKASSTQLPDWGFMQGEVTCRPHLKAGSRLLDGAAFLWNVEHHVNSALPPAEPGVYRSRFLHDFVEHNIGMWRTNNALVPDPELELGQLASYPRQWLFLSKGSRMSGWDEKKQRFLMLGNPAVWWASSLAVLALLAVWAGSVLAAQRGIPADPAFWAPLSYRLRVALGAWFLNYAPYFLMGRITYLHHYYPSLVHAIVAIGVALDAATDRIDAPLRRMWVRRAAVGALLALFAAGFWYFSPIAYGMDGNPEYWAMTRKWLSGWNF